MKRGFIVEIDLKNYITFCKDLEISLYKQKRMISQIKDNINQVSNPKLFGRIEHVNIKREYNGLMDSSSLIKNLLWCVIIVWIGMMLGGLIGAAIDYGGILNIVCILSGSVPGFICCIIEVKRYIQAIKNTTKRNQEIDSENIRIEQKNKDILKKMPQQKAMLIEQLNRSMQIYTETKEILNDLYMQGIIFEKYRAMIPVCMFYEYLASGRCNTLEGPNGAYNLYESELKANIIIGRLDIIISKLDEIKETQYIVAHASRDKQTITNNYSQLTDICRKIK